jgi:hypothetical protein
MVYARRKAIFAGVLGGDRKWLIFGGAAWVFHWLGRIFGVGTAIPRYTQEINAGQRVVVVHEPAGRLDAKKATKVAKSANKKALKAAAKAETSGSKRATKKAARAAKRADQKAAAAARANAHR